MSKRGWHLLPVCVLVELQNQQSCSRAALEVEPNRVRGILGERTPHLETKSWQRPLIAVRADHARTGHEASLPESKALSYVQLFAPSWPVVHQVPPSMGFPRQEYWSGLPLPSPMTNLGRVLKSRDVLLPTKVCLVKAMVFPLVMYGCESWTIKKAECRKN